VTSTQDGRECLTSRPGRFTTEKGLPRRYGCFMIYLLTAIGLTSGGSSTVHIYTQTIHRTTQLTTYLGRVRAVHRLCELYPDICRTTKQKKTEKPQSE
jgi:uncharacterized integral membrane protein